MSNLEERGKEDGMKKQYAESKIEFIEVVAPDILAASDQADDPEAPIELPVLPV